MKNIIKGYLVNLSIEDINNHAIKYNINLSEDELIFTYNFIKNNYEEILDNPDSFNFSDYEAYYSKENFSKINQLIKKYYNYL